MSCVLHLTRDWKTFEDLNERESLTNKLKHCIHQRRLENDKNY